MGGFAKSSEARAAGEFDGVIAHDGSGIVAMIWNGHIDARRLSDHLRALESVVSVHDRYYLLIDVTQVSGYDLDARDVARRWAERLGPRAPVAVAIVAESRLAAIESPGSVLAPRRARFFTSVHPARRWLQGLAVTTSGEYDLSDVLTGFSLRRG